MAATTSSRATLRPHAICARAPVRRHAARDDEPRLVVRAQVAKRFEALLVEESVRDVELRLDVRLGPGRADGGGVALGPEEQADRLGHDRLPRAGLARQGDEPGRELELGLADENEVLDAQTTQHRGDRRPGTRVANTGPSGRCWISRGARSQAEKLFR